MAVYDEDPQYAEKLSDYINRKDQGIFTAQAFTSFDALETFAQENKIDVLLAGQGGGQEDFHKVPAAWRMMLSEEQPGGIPVDPEGKSIYKYQPGDAIVREVLAHYGEMPGLSVMLSGAVGQSKRMIGVYSPVGRCGKTSFALSVGQILAKEEKTLFLSLDVFTGFSSFMDERWKRDLSDLLYYYKQGRFHAVRLNSVIYYLGDMAWLPPIRFPDDYLQISTEEMAGLLETILQESDYTTVVLDMGSSGKQMLPLLELCSVIYMPVKEDIFSQAKLTEFFEYLEICKKQSIAERIQKIHVPMTPGNRRFERFPQEFMWGDVGDFARGMLRGQNGNWRS